MAEAASSDSLADKFKKANHYRHILMDISMIGMAIGGLVATAASGGTLAFLDPIGQWIGMHFSGLGGYLQIGEFFNIAAESAQYGTYATDSFFTLDHAAHGAHSVAEHAAHIGGASSQTELTNGALELLGLPQ